MCFVSSRQLAPLRSVPEAERAPPRAPESVRRMKSAPGLARALMVDRRDLADISADFDLVPRPRVVAYEPPRLVRWARTDARVFARRFAAMLSGAFYAMGRWLAAASRRI